MCKEMPTGCRNVLSETGQQQQQHSKKTCGFYYKCCYIAPIIPYRVSGFLHVLREEAKELGVLEVSVRLNLGQKGSEGLFHRLCRNCRLMRPATFAQTVIKGEHANKNKKLDWHKKE